MLGQPWQSLGPTRVSTAAYGSVTGRVSSIAADPSDVTGNTLYIGTTGGGVWKSTNAAAAPSSVSFTPLTDDLPAFSSGSLASLSIGAITVQPGGTGVVLAGTGDPNDALDSYYGSGLLRSADGGLTWTLIPSSNDSSVNSLTNFYFVGEAFAGFAWSTTTPNLVVAAVADSAEGLLVNANSIYSDSDIPHSVSGLYYSMDAGQTWLLATITDGPGQVVQTTSIPLDSGGNPATSVVWNPVRRKFYAAVRFHGYYESADGITWTRLANQPGSGLTTTECPAEPNSVGSPACPIFRGSLAVQPVTGDMFALTVDVNLLDQGLWQDVCAAASGACASGTVVFGQQLPSSALEDGTGAIEFGDYSLGLAAVPSGADTLLFVGTQDVFRCSLLAGCEWRNATNTESCGAAEVAPFQHAMDSTFSASLSLMYFGNDSGLWRSTDNANQPQPPCSSDDANHFQNLNGGLGSLAEVQGLAQDPSDSGIVLAGLGVNGVAAATASGQAQWPQVLDGYGSYVAIDPVNPKNWYAQSAPGVAIDLCPEGSACDSAGFGTPVVGAAQVGVDEAYASPLPSPFILDPRGSANVILGTCHVWLGPADGVAWSDANLLGDLYPGEGPECDGNAFVQSLAATGTITSQTGNFESIYAGMAGVGFDGPQAYSGHLFQARISASSPVPAAWSDLWLSPVANDARGFNPCDFSVSSVVTDPHDTTGMTVYATIEGFNTPVCSTGIVYASTNGGVSWVNISANLPRAPANSLAVDPNDANTVYIALDTGVYVTTSITECSTQNCWSVYGTGLPNSPVLQLATFYQAGESGGVGSQSLLRAATYGRGVWQIPLVTAASTSTTATATPSSLSFSNQAVQTQSPAQTVTVTNTGAIPLTLSQVAISGDFAESANCATSIAVGGNCAVSVTFGPVATGVRTGALTIYANVPGGQLAVPLSGTGVPGSSIVLLPASLSFGPSLIGISTTPAEDITISNTGGISATLQQPAVTGDFSIVANTCSASLAPNFGCTVSLTFTPTASGQRSGMFSIIDSAGTQTATLSGTGEAPATDTVSPTSLSFAAQVVGSTSAAQTVTLTNSGDSPLNSIQVAVGGDFRAVNGCAETLIGHANCAVAVTFVPTTVGAESGALTINDMYGRPQTIALTGTGLPPPGVVSALPTSVDFGPYAVGGTTPPQTVTITNSGSVPLNDLGFVTAGEFITTTNCPATLAVGANCVAQVAFTPGHAGNLAGSLTISSNSLAMPFQIALAGNGLAFTFQAQGSPSQTIVSGATTPAYSLVIVPSVGSTGTLLLNCSALPPNSTCTVNPLTVTLHADGTTSSVSVTIATTAAVASARGGRFPLWALALSCGLFALPRSRKKVSQLVACLCIALLPLGCGVTSSAGSSGTTGTNGGGSAPAATYNPVVTAVGPGISQSVQLTLIVE